MESNTLLAFLKKASEDEGLRKELVALAGRYGIPLGADELSEASLDQVAGGLLTTVQLGMSSLQTKLTGNINSVTGKKVTSPLEIGTLGDGSV